MAASNFSDLDASWLRLWLYVQFAHSSVAPSRREGSQWHSGGWTNDAWPHAVTAGLRYNNSGRELSAVRCNNLLGAECRTGPRQVLTYFVLVPRSDATPGLRALCYRHRALSDGDEAAEIKILAVLNIRHTCRSTVCKAYVIGPQDCEFDWAFPLWASVADVDGTNPPVR
jgi:hypothetical protein